MRDLINYPLIAVNFGPVALGRHLAFGEQVRTAERQRHVERPRLAGGAGAGDAGRRSFQRDESLHTSAGFDVPFPCSPVKLTAR